MIWEGKRGPRPVGFRVTSVYVEVVKRSYRHTSTADLKLPIWTEIFGLEPPFTHLAWHF